MLSEQRIASLSTRLPSSTLDLRADRMTHIEQRFTFTARRLARFSDEPWMHHTANDLLYVHHHLSSSSLSLIPTLEGSFPSNLGELIPFCALPPFAAEQNLALEKWDKFFYRSNIVPVPVIVPAMTVSNHKHWPPARKFIDLTCPLFNHYYSPEAIKSFIRNVKINIHN